MNRRHTPLLLLALLSALAVAFLVFARQAPGASAFVVWVGSWFGGASPEPAEAFAFSSMRLPRLLVAIFGGASLAIAGAVMQATFRNPLASPDLVGTAAGAAFGGAVTLVLGFEAHHVLMMPLGSLVGAIAVTSLVFVLARSHGRFAVATLLLAGIALHTLVGALTAFVVTFTYDNYTASSRVLFFLMGGLDDRNWGHAWITLGGCVLFTAMVLPRVRELDLLTLHDDSAHSLGVDPGRARRWLVWCACGLTATTVANTGGIAFVGLVVPHLARLLVGPSHRVLLPTAALLGAVLLVGSDLVCRLVPADWNLRLGVVTALLGAPYFLLLLARHRRGEAL